ncbi:MAG: zinc ribbon domain-containing protein [Dehalococcoidales bacterium]|nr:zinc ribbon domain-containing protein [Dehalococcoidales bacterium]
MFCPNCGSEVQAGNKFCSRCGAPVASPNCPGCGSPVKSDAAFCPNCGFNLKGMARAPALSPAQPGIATDLRDLAPGEVVLMDTGIFPISYIKNIMSSVNGKLYLTSQRIVFKAGKLQGVGGVSSGGMFIPNTKDAYKSKEYFAIPLSEVASVDSGWSSITVHARTNYKFGGMRKTKEWANEIRRLIQSR